MIGQFRNETDDVQLTIGDQIETTSGETVTVPIRFSPGNADVIGLAFSIDFDERCLTFDPQDLDSNGFPDAVQFFTPAAFNKIFFLDLNDTAGELDIVLIDFFAPYTTITALEELMTINFTAACDVPAGETALATVAFAGVPIPSYTTTTGQTNTPISLNGSILIHSAHPLPTATTTPVPTPTITPTPTLIPTMPPTTPTATPTLVPTAPPVTIVERFEAEPVAAGIRLHWQTSLEVNTRRFAVHRLALGQDSTFVPLAGTVAGQGSQGGVYTLLDDQVDANSRYSYLLVEEKLNGRFIFYNERLIVAGQFVLPTEKLLIPLIMR